jgi:hypothetical protein
VTAATVLAEAVVRERQWTFERALRAINAAGWEMLALAREGWVQPRFSEIVQARETVITTRCASPGCRNRCSRCARATAIEKNRRLYGSDDFPGAAS